MIGKLLADDEPPINKKSKSENVVSDLSSDQNSGDVLELPEDKFAEQNSAPIRANETVAAIREQIESESGATGSPVSQPPDKSGAAFFSPERAALEQLPPIGKINAPDEIGQPIENTNTAGEADAPLMDAAAETVAALDNAAPLEDLPQTNFEFSTFADAPKKSKIKYEDDGFSSEETIRGSGLAWSAGIAFFGSIVFTMIIGWFADLLFGSKPWGIVGGIILGAIIGFIQFFRISSQIFKKD